MMRFGRWSGFGVSCGEGGYTERGSTPKGPSTPRVVCVWFSSMSSVLEITPHCGPHTSTTHTHSHHTHIQTHTSLVSRHATSLLIFLAAPFLFATLYKWVCLVHEE